MKLDILTALNDERAARRAAIVITNVENGKQRFVKAGETGKDPLRAALVEHLRTGKSGMAETAEGRVFLTVYVPAPQLVITGAVHISQALAPISTPPRAVARLFLYRVVGREKNSPPPRRTAQGARLKRIGYRTHPCADRARYRR